MDYEFSKHALEQIAARGIAQDLVHDILSKPNQVVEEEDYTVYQSVVNFEGKPYLIRVFVNTAVEPLKIITVYKTSKIDKYYEGEV